MPNWVSNKLTVMAPTMELLEDFCLNLSKPYVTYYSTMEYVDGKWQMVKGEQEVKQAFAFWNILSPDCSVHDEYFGTQPLEVNQPTTSMMDNPQKWWAEVVDLRRKSNYWYDWNITNWGTKWEASDVVRTEITKHKDEYVIEYDFTTAWSPVSELLLLLSENWPRLAFFYEYQEEQGWGGTVVMKGGEVFEQTQWDIPNSHAEEIEHRGICWRCDDDPDPTSWYDDCPDKQKLIAELKENDDD